MPLIEIHKFVTNLLELGGKVQLVGSLKDRREAEYKTHLTCEDIYKVNLLHLIDEAEDWQRASLIISDDVLAVPSNVLSGNHQVYKCLDKILDLDINLDNEIKDMRFLVHVSQLRAIRGSSHTNGFNYRKDSDERTMLKLIKVGEIMLRLYGLSCTAMEEKIKGLVENPRCQSQTSESKAISVCSFGPVVLVDISGSITTMTVDHFHKLLDSCISYRNYLILVDNVVAGVTDGGTKLLRKLTRIGMRHHNRLGEGCKAGKNRYTWRLSKDRIFQRSAEADLSSTYDDWKLDISDSVIDCIDDITNSSTARIQLGYFFKYAPHPDIDIVKCFKNTLGVKEANPVDETALPKLRGMLKKSLFIASLKSGEALRVIEGDPYLVSQTVRPTPDYKRMSDIGPDRWITAVFAKSPEYSDYLDIDLKTLDRSHTIELANMDLGSNIELDKGYLTGLSKQKVRITTLFSSDLKAKYISEDQPTAKEARDYFAKVVKLHVAYERKIGRRATSADLELFFKECPEAFHLVGTEGKFGEQGKDVTRMFYLASPKMKLYLSLVERVLKKVSKGQLGNSIVKSYASRTSDLTAFAHSCRGPGEKVYPMYLSFDMSEFSKKFPGENMKILGEVLAELTGDNALQRLDIAFRSAVVGHSTRGLKASYSGVTGGFEGFLNFGWTTLHVSIMTIALREAGVSGIVLAYSDDGVLYFLVTGDQGDAYERIKLAVVTIQTTYRRFGLVFHLGKTLISASTFEYLGEIGDDGRFIDTWPKALSKLGITERSTALTTFGSTIDTYIGQASSAISAGLPFGSIEPYLYYHAYLKARRVDSRLKVDDFVGLMILPRTCGGIALPCGINMSLDASRDSASEYFADVDGIYRAYPKIAEKTMAYIDSRIDNPEDSLARMIMGSSISTSAVNLSGISLLVKAGNLLRDRLGRSEVTHPLTSGRARSIRVILNCLDDISPTTTASIISALPDMDIYDSVIQEGKSKGAAKLLDRDTIKKLQSSDTRKVRKGVVSYMEFKRYDINVADLMKLVNSRLRSNGFSPIRPSIRMLLFFAKGRSADIVVSTDFLSYNDLGVGRRIPVTCNDLPYMHPQMSTDNKADRLIFQSEQTKDNRLPAKLLKVVSNIVRRNPEFSAAAAGICCIMDVALPDMLALRGANARRLRLFRNKPDLTLNISPLVKGRSTVIMGSEVRLAYISGLSMDRTTLEYISLVVASNELYKAGSLVAAPPLGRIKTRLNITDKVEALFDRKITLLRPIPKEYLEGKIDDPFNKTLISAFKQEMIDAEAYDRLISLEGMDESEMSMMLDFYAGKMSRLIIHRLRGISTVSDLRPIQKDTTSVPYNRAILDRAAEMVILWYKKKSRLDVHDEMIEALVSELTIYKDYLPVDMIDQVSKSTARDIDAATDAEVVAESLFSSARVFVVDTGVLHGNDAVINKVRACVRETIREVYSVSTESGWEARYKTNRATISVSDGHNGLEADYLLDMLSVGYDSMRRSKHRASMYNKVTYEIVAYQLYACRYNDKVTLDADSSDDEEDDDSVGDEYLGKSEGVAITEIVGKGKKESVAYKLSKEAISYFLLRHKGVLGPDHLAILKSDLSFKSTLRKAIYDKYNSKRRGGGSDEMSFPDAYEESIRIQHTFSQVISSLIANKVKQVDIRSFVDEDMSHGNIIQRLPPTSSPGCIMTGLDGVNDTDACSIIWSNLSLLMSSEGFASVKITSYIPPEIINDKLDSVIVSNDGVPLTFKKISKDSIILINEAYDTASRAACAYSTFMTVGSTSLSLVRIGDSYNVIGAMYNESKRLRNAVYDPDYLDEYKAKMAFPTSNQVYVTSLMAASGCYKSMVQRDSPRSHFQEHGGLTVRQISRAPVTINHSPMLAAASALCTGGTNVELCYYAYKLVEGHLKSSTIDEVRESYLEDIAGLNETRFGRLAVKGVQMEASSIRSYFILNPVTTSVQLNIPGDHLLPPKGFPARYSVDLCFHVIPKKTRTIGEIGSMRERLAPDEVFSADEFLYLENIV